MGVRVLSQRNEDFVSNSYLVIHEETGAAALIDCGAPVDHLLAVLADENLELEQVLLTHHHVDHISGLGDVLERHPDAQVRAHPLEAAEMMGVTETILPGDLTGIGGLDVVALATPGHTAGMLSFVVRDPGGPDQVFTGDTLFAGSVGGVRAPGHTTLADLRHSVLDVLLALPDDTVVQPGHAEPTTIGQEAHDNPFVLLWKGEREPGAEQVTVQVPWDPADDGRAATLVLWADDYDGGHKAQVVYADDGAEDLVPGSWIKRSGA